MIFTSTGHETVTYNRPYSASKIGKRDNISRPAETAEPSRQSAAGVCVARDFCCSGGGCVQTDDGRGGERVASEPRGSEGDPRRTINRATPAAD